MKILSIETSCDETALALVDVNIEANSVQATELESELFSQIDIHKEFGGVFPAVAKREHAKHAPLLLEKLLKKISKPNNPLEDGLVILDLIGESVIPDLIGDPEINSLDSRLHGNDELVGNDVQEETWTEIQKLLEREVDMFEHFKKTVTQFAKPEIDALAVTTGPGLEPALWVGINFARALSLYWNIPLIPTNHMKGHIFSVLLNQKEIEFPALALLVSGGHTEIVELNSFSDFKVIGRTKDDAVGESYDKVARMLGIEYPGGPVIAGLAQNAREKNIGSGEITLPRPMLHSPDFDFSFSGLKTAVLYKIRDVAEMTEQLKMNIAHEFEEAVIEVLLYKTKKALEQKDYRTFIVSGGVIANTHLRERLLTFEATHDVTVLFPKTTDSTDNAQMIAVAGAISAQSNTPIVNPEIRAQGNLEY